MSCVGKTFTCSNFVLTLVLNYDTMKYEVSGLNETEEFNTFIEAYEYIRKILG